MVFITFIRKEYGNPILATMEFEGAIPRKGEFILLPDSDRSHEYIYSAKVKTIIWTSPKECDIYVTWDDSVPFNKRKCYKPMKK